MAFGQWEKVLRRWTLELREAYEELTTGMIEQIPRTPDRVCVTPEGWVSLWVWVERQTDGLAHGQKEQEKKPLSNMNLHFSSASLLSVLHSNEYPTAKTIRLRDKNIAFKGIIHAWQKYICHCFTAYFIKTKSLIMHLQGLHKAFILSSMKLSWLSIKTITLSYDI